MPARSYPSFLIYLADTEDFRWRFQAEHLSTIADCSRAYRHYKHCRNAIALIASPHDVWRTQAVIERVI